MSIHVRVRMSKVTCTKIKVDVGTYTQHTPIVEPCHFNKLENCFDFSQE